MFFQMPLIRGKNERQIFRNFVHDYPELLLETQTDSIFDRSKMKTKSDIQSLNFRQKANRLYSKKGTLEKCMKLYNKSLRYAIYNGENYAKALANRSALLFRMFEYEKSIEDIDLCLKSKCPNSLKPKVYMRKCECYKNLGDRKNLKKTVKEFKLFMNAELSDTIANQYKQKLDDLLSKDEAKVIRFDDDCFELPTMERNPEFEELSVDVVLKNDKKGKFYLASSRSIKKGQVVLLEKAYAFSTNHEKKFCQYCLKKIVNGIPCKICVKHMYCGESCQTSAWNEFHRWECCAVQAGFFCKHTDLQLVLRIITKTCHQRGSLTPSPTKTKKSDKYSLIYGMDTLLHNKSEVQICTVNAMFLVSYLKTKTNFFEYLLQFSSFKNKSEKDVKITIGALIVRYLIRLKRTSLLIVDFCNFDMEDRYSGFGICSSFAYINHKCDANTVYYFHDDTVVVKASTDIKPNTKLTCSILMNHLDLMVERRAFLWDVCQKKCNCENCSNPLFVSSVKDQQLMIPTTSEKFKCLSCDYVFKMPPNIEMSMVLAAHFKNRFLVFNDIGMAYDAFNLSKTFLNPYHHFFEELYDKMSRFYLEKGEHGAAFDLLERQLDYIVTRTSKKTVENVLNYIRYSIRILQNIAQQVDIRSDVFIKALVSVEDALEKARELNSYLYPPLMKIIKIQQMLCFYQQLRSLRSN